MGYHANVYYRDLQPPPRGAHFSPEWGLMGGLGTDTTGDWHEFDTTDVQTAVRNLADNPDFDPCLALQEEAIQAFEAHRSDVISILEINIEQHPDRFLERSRAELENLATINRNEIVRRLSPGGQIMTRDTLALTQGLRTPPHISIVADVLLAEHALDTLNELQRIAANAGAHLQRSFNTRRQQDTPGTNVFIGHGRSVLWRELSEFITLRLNLPVDEFNRVAAAGQTNLERLSEMMDSASFAFIVMTGEDEQPDGQLRARMNVVHEAGLFQGRLGFRRAIILLEDGCEEFTNIEGLVQIRFPVGNIGAVFEEVRRVLERERLVT